MAVERRLAILGAAGGLGRALVDRALAEGWEVIALDLAASFETSSLSADVHCIPIDLREPATVEAAFAQAGQIDGFVNLAGFMSPIRPLFRAL